MFKFIVTNYIVVSWYVLAEDKYKLIHSFSFLRINDCLNKQVGPGFSNKFLLKLKYRAYRWNYNFHRKK
jgi:hypothetical protein